MPRRTLYWARFLSLSLVLSACYVVGVASVFLVYGYIGSSILLLLVVGLLLTFIFIATSLWISINVVDRMKGVGLVFGLWLYLVLIHDAVILMLLLFLADYPMDVPGGLLGVSSPIGLARVTLLMASDSSMLLGHIGALVRNILTSWRGYAIALSFSVLWVAVPLLLSLRAFRRRDF